jgi:hypothetical protein
MDFVKPNGYLRLGYIGYTYVHVHYKKIERFLQVGGMLHM